MRHAALLVNADGTTETLSGDEAFGNELRRRAKCSSCGQPQGPERRYVGQWASNSDTESGGGEKPSKGSGGPKNGGCIVFIEAPL